MASDVLTDVASGWGLVESNSALDRAVGPGSGSQSEFLLAGLRLRPGGFNFPEVAAGGPDQIGGEEQIDDRPNRDEGDVV